MPFDTTIMTKRIEGLKEAYENGRFGDALVGALNTGNGIMQQRVFQETQDVKGQSFGVYIGKKRKVKELPATKNRTQAKRNKSVEGQELTSYQRKRALKGRQIAKKDLEFDGGLRRAIETQIENEKSAVLEFNNDLAAKIATGQEQQIENIRNGKSGTTKGTGATKIFALNESEKEKVVEQGSELIKQILKPK
jgi:hypothetical protein